MSQTMSAARLRRMQWAVRLTLALGVAASVTANVLHARPNPISQTIAAWPPLALLITVELVSRIPIYRRGLGVVRITATSAIAAIAAWVSYHHMAAVVARYGEVGTVPYLLPLSVDGLVVVASVSLVELAGRRRETEPHPAPVQAPAAAAGAASAAVAEEGHAAATAGSVEADGRTSTTAPKPSTTPSRGEKPRTGDWLRPSDPIPGHSASLSADHDFEPDADHLDDYPNNESDAGQGSDFAADLVPLLPAARAARDELVREGRTVSRDALASRLRRNGHTIRNNRVSELLAALRDETQWANGRRPTAPM